MGCNNAYMGKEEIVWGEYTVKDNTAILYYTKNGEEMASKVQPPMTKDDLKQKTIEWEKRNT
jgi:hypothetical protein